MKELLHDFDIKEEGKQEINQLIQMLAGQNRMEDIIRSAKDTEYQQKLLKEFNLA